MKTKNSFPSSEFEHKDKCPSCGSLCNIYTDLDKNDECNDCRSQIDILELGQITPKQETLEEEYLKDELKKYDGIGVVILNKPEEPKQETLEEAATNIYGTGYGGLDSVSGFIDGAKWQQERSYSEEEVLELLEKIQGQTSIDYNDDFMFAKEWFEQFKKK